ncbi:MAG: tRNA(Met) cytidine acetyltransferase [Gammaproteobacteria bacterium]|nr:tRNA(Met) cytidine acetyltransferase [Gammaproteobacteria bacterium]
MQTWLSEYAQTLIHNHHRQAIILAGDHHWAWQLINPWLSQFNTNIYVGQGELKHAYLECVKASKPSTLLGYESDNVVFDAHHGLFPDALTAIAGTIKPGGFLFLLAPPLDEWPLLADEFAQGRTSLGFEDTSHNQHTVQRLLATAASHGIPIYEQGKNAEQLTKINQIKSAYTHNKPTNSQQSVYLSILNSFRNEVSHNLHVITADRGRGKSHLLGMLADSFINSPKDNGINYYLCAPNKAATQNVYKHLNEQSKQALSFLAPERLLEQAKPQDIIFVDEAASLPIPLLMQWSQHFQHMIFASTTHGYEGTGKGFQIRFFRHLNALQTHGKIQWQQHALEEPVRYAKHDPIETWLFDAFCLDCEPSALSLSEQTIHACLGTLKTQYIKQDVLSNKPDLLKQVFALLVQAHYQTRPSDLRDLLDAPGLELFMQTIEHEQQEHVIGVCLINLEGPIKNSASVNGLLHDDILNGYRRPKGHLIPQVLAHHMGQSQALNLKAARIVRIATLENCQRLGLGSQLLDSVKQYCLSKNIDYLGSSYADTDDVRHFWFKNDFRLVRQGNKLDKASGTQSALVLLGLSSQGKNLEQNALKFFSRQGDMIPSIENLKPFEKNMLDIFLQHNGSYETAKSILSRIDGFDLHFPKKATKEFKRELQDWLESQEQD